MRLLPLLLTLFLVVPPLALTAQKRRGDRLTFDRYHDARATAAILKSLARRHPKLIRIRSLGKSGQDKDIPLAVVTDFSTGKPEEKPGILVEGNIHGNERIGGEAALMLIHQLVTRRSQDARIDDLLRTRTFWVVPKSNPDAADAWVRGVLKPEDDDGDGKEDEDGPDDVDGNGLITSMRIVDPEGRFIPDPEDDRLMVPFSTLTVKQRRRYRGSRYRIVTEGIDNDDDGEVNEDGPDWEIDPNRDFPADLKMERKYRKKYARGGNTRMQGRPSKVQRGKEPEPEFLRTAETRALSSFLTATPSLALTISFHSYGNVLFRPFGYIPDKAGIPRSDLKRLNELGLAFRRLTGFDGYGAPYLGERQVVGGLHDYCFWDFGIPGLTVEIWSVPGIGRDWADRDSRRTDRGGGRGGGRGGRDQWRNRRGNPGDQRKMLAWVDAEKVQDGWFPWKPYDHPTYGEVEIGGLWSPSRLRYNPPPSRIQATLKPFVAFALEAAQATPLLRVVEARVKPSRSRVRTIEAEIMNIGSAPTAWRLACKRKLATVPRVLIELAQGVSMSSGRAERTLQHLKAGETVRARWSVVLPDGPGPWEVTVTVISRKGGTHRRKVRLEAPAIESD